MQKRPTINVKLLLFALVTASLLITITPEYRNILILLFALGSASWLFLIIRDFKIFTKKPELDKQLKYFLYPAMAFNIILTIINKDYRDAGVGYVYIALGIITYLTYFSPTIQSKIVGIPKNAFKGLFIGVFAAIVFLFIGNAIPGFSILIPAVPFSILQSVRGFIVIGIAPIMEEDAFRSGLLAALQAVYGFSVATAITIQAILFTIYHFLAYGIFLGSLNNLTELVGATNAISGLLISALLFGIVSGFIAYKFKNMIILKVMHMIINGVLFS